jgi:hypothetical protein
MPRLKVDIRLEYVVSEYVHKEQARLIIKDRVIAAILHREEMRGDPTIELKKAEVLNTDPPPDRRGNGKED